MYYNLDRLLDRLLVSAVVIPTTILHLLRLDLKMTH